MEVQVVQAPDVLLTEEAPVLPAPTLNLENSLATFLDEQNGHLILLAAVPVTRSSKIFLQLAHSYSKIGKLIPPIALAIIS